MHFGRFWKYNILYVNNIVSQTLQSFQAESMSKSCIRQRESDKENTTDTQHVACEEQEPKVGGAHGGEHKTFDTHYFVQTLNHRHRSQMISDPFLSPACSSRAVKQKSPEGRQLEPL